MRTACSIANRSAAWIFLLAGVLLAVAVPQPAGAQPKPADADLVKALRAGGHAIIMRHAAADPDKGDADPLNFKAIARQQPLTEAGKVDARQFGERLRAIGIPVGEVLTSRFNRANLTAVLAGFKNAKPVTELTEGSLVASPNEQRRRASALKQLAASPLPTGTNRLLVTHRTNMMQAFGKEWFEVKEGEASIFRLENGGYTLVTRLQIEEWKRLVEAANSPPPPAPASPPTQQPAQQPTAPAVQAPAVQAPAPANVTPPAPKQP